MKASTTVNFLRHIRNMVAASGKKRVIYAITNIVVMALGVFFALCVKWCWTGTFVDGSMPFIGGLLGLIVTIPLTLLTFLQGFVAQFALVFITAIGIGNREERRPNVAAFLIALLTSVGLIVAGVILLKTVL